MPQLKSLLEDLLNSPGLPLEELMDIYLTPGYRQRTDGLWSTREEVAEHFAHLRAVVASAEVRGHEELTNQQHYAERHTVAIDKRDGGQVVQEVYAFASLAPDGRFDRLEEATMMLAGDEADRTIANARHQMPRDRPN